MKQCLSELLFYFFTISIQNHVYVRLAWVSRISSEQLTAYMFPSHALNPSYMWTFSKLHGFTFCLVCKKTYKLDEIQNKAY